MKARSHLMNPGAVPPPVRPRSPFALLVLLLVICGGIYLLLRSPAEPGRGRPQPTTVVAAQDMPALERAFHATEPVILDAPPGTAAETARHAAQILNAAVEGTRYVLDRPSGAWQVVLVPVEPGVIRVEAYATSLELPVLMTEVTLPAGR